MREVIIIIVVLVLVTTTSILMQKYLIKSSDELGQMLEELKTEIQSADETGNLEKVNNLSEMVLEKWEEINKFWSMIIVHQELDSIELSMLGVKGFIESGSIKDSMEEIEKSIFLVGHIKEKEAFKLKNIF